jgi:hypothetical protein
VKISNSKMVVMTFKGKYPLKNNSLKFIPAIGFIFLTILDVTFMKLAVI